MTENTTGEKPAREQRVELVLEALVIIAAMATIPLTYAESQGATGPLVTTADWGIWAIFTLEFVILYYYARDKRTYVRQSWLSIAIVIVSFPVLPYLLQLARLVRLIRLIRLVRLLRLAGATSIGLRALQRIFGRQGVLFVGTASIILVLAGGAALALLEPEVTDGGVGTGIWWALVTATTVGYGDVAPETVAGRAVGVMLMFLGIGIVGTLAASIAAYFIDPDESEELAELRKRVAELEDLNDRLDRIEVQQSRIEDLVRNGSGSEPENR
jgi:voltage-gated potassium channel